MVIKYRGDLTKLFGNSTVPEASSFAALINSTLVKRDDQFYGKWQAGVGYAKGDVVLYNNTFYYFVEKGKKPNGSDCNCDDCGNTAPSDESCCWKPIRFKTTDHEWDFIVENKQNTGLIANASGKMGIGTKEPKAFFHINDDKKGCGQLLFNPLNTSGRHLPMLKMVNLSIQPKVEDTENCSPESAFVSQSLDEKKVIFMTDTEGYLFRQKGQIASENAQNPSNYDEIHPHHEGHTEGSERQTDSVNPLLIVTAKNQYPRIGIGTETPEASLDLRIEGRGQIRADAGEVNDPDVTLFNKSGEEVIYLSETITTQQAALVTNAPDGFLFKTDQSAEERFHKCGNERSDSGEPLMVIQPDEVMQVKVGIGTSDPKAQLEVEGKEGKVQMSLHDMNPSLNIVNKIIDKNGNPTDTNFLSVGAMGAHADQQAVFSTNSQNGFVFRHTQQPTNGVPSVNKGNKFLFLKRDKSSKDAFSMTMDGRVAAKGFYAAAAPDDASYLAKHKALEYIKTFKPTVYSVQGEDEKQYGFLASEMPSGLDELVRDFDGLGKEDKAIAYHSIVTLLVGAVKDLSETVTKLDNRVKELETRKGHK